LRHDIVKISQELNLIAQGKGYYGGTLRSARDMIGITSSDYALLERWLEGSQTNTDHVALQTLALKILTWA